MDMLQQLFPSLLVVLLVVIFLVYLWRINKRDLVKKIVLGFVVQAEKALGSGTGELKYAMVVDSIYTKLPAIVTLLYSKKEIDTMIEDGVIKLKEILGSGVELTSYDDEWCNSKLLNK